MQVVSHFAFIRFRTPGGSPTLKTHQVVGTRSQKMGSESDQSLEAQGHTKASLGMVFGYNMRLMAQFEAV